MENPYNGGKRHFKFPTKAEINAALASFSKKEWAIFTSLFIIFILSSLLLLNRVNRHFMITIPADGGSITEGIIGAPRFINPVLATSIADEDLASLVYSGLMRKNSDGTLSPDLAEKYEVSTNGLTYTFTLKNNIFFHNNAPVTADDIIFTINKVKDGVIKSPHKASWDGVSVEKTDQRTVVFTLRQPYAAFLENATIGILPMSIWNNSTIELNSANTSPVGSGPFFVKNIVKESSGSITAIELERFKKFALGQPHIKNFTIKFYPNEAGLVAALKGGDIDQASSITPANAQMLKDDYQVDQSVLPRIFGLFFNQNQNQLFIEKPVVKAIADAINKDRIITEILHGYGVAISDPIPSALVEYQTLSSLTQPTREEVLKKVGADLAKAGWKPGEDGILEKVTTDKNKKKTTTKLAFSISTGNAPELTQTAAIIQEDLQALGMKVEVKTFEVGNLNQGVIRPRKYDALLFGQIINDESDLFAFWHSSQRKDPGLNVAMYTNAKVDKILEDAFITLDSVARVKKYIQFEDEIKKDMPAVFIYSPDFIYVVDKNVKGVTLENIVSPSDRFSNVYSWFIDTEDVWKVFTK